MKVIVVAGLLDLAGAVVLPGKVEAAVKVAVQPAKEVRVAVQLVREVQVAVQSVREVQVAAQMAKIAAEAVQPVPQEAKSKYFFTFINVALTMGFKQIKIHEDYNV